MTLSDTPLISVIVPVHDVRDHVAACIASLRAQTLIDFECLVIDDGSTDDSAARAAAAIGGDARFTLIRQDNRGLSGARNAGLDRARGAFVAFVDSDDRVMPDYLQGLWRALEDTGCDWVACGIRFCPTDGTGHTHSAIHGAAASGDHIVPRRHRFVEWSDVIRHFPSAWNKLYRATLIEGLRFDEGTWFEDHGFFLRVAQRTDHLLHLPAPLYLQTRGRPGQITASDDERVFEQFAVLSRMRALMDEGPHGGAATGFARIASRLLFERSTALRDPARRARFAAAAADFLRCEGIAYTPGWDDDIAQSWALEMAGERVLSVILTWDGHDTTALEATLDSLAQGRGPAHELVLVCRDGSAARRARGRVPEEARILVQRDRGRGLGLALREATGACVAFLTAGDRLHPWALAHWCDTLLRHDGDFGLAAYDRDGVYHSGVVDPRPWPMGLPDKGVLPLSPAGALALDPHLSSKIVRRAFLLEQSLSFAPGPDPEQAFCLSAALSAERVVRIPQVGIKAAPDTAERPGPATLWRRHGALVRALPGAVRQALPDGWQRRLFARALWQQVHPRRPPGRARFAAMLAGAAAAAAIHRIDRQAGAPAGVDPCVGPRLGLLMDPRGMIRRSMAARRLVTTPPPSPAPITRDTPLCCIPLGEAGLFRFRVDFRDTDYANLYFHDSGCRIMPFHLSLRLREEVAVCNNRDANGIWGTERRKPLRLADTEASVEIRIAPPHVTVWIDGLQMFHHGAPGLRRRSGFRGLDTIAWVELQGAIALAGAMPHIPAPGGLLLDDRLQLCAAPPPGVSFGEMRLRCTPNGPDLPLFAQGADELGLTPLDGWLWQMADADAFLGFELRASDGRVLDRLRIGRDDMARRLSDLLTQGVSPRDGTLALSVLEHLRYAGLMPLLDPDARTRAHALADEYDLNGFLAADETDADDDAAPPLAAPPRDPVMAEIDSAVAMFMESQRQDPAPDPLETLRLIALPGAARRDVYLTLCEEFCRPGRDFDGFAALAGQAGVLDGPLPTDRWSMSALLPLLLAVGRAGDVHALLLRLADWGEGWVLTTPVGFTLERTLAQDTLDYAEQEAIIYAAMDFVDRRSADYWDRMQCHDLIRAAVALVRALPRLSPYLQRDAIAFVLRSYGLSRAFWRMLRDAGVSLPARLAYAAEAFETVAGQGPDADRARALAFFDRAGCIDAPRLGREILGPAGLPLAPGAMLTLADLVETGTDPAQNALRHMAFPGSAPVEDGVRAAVAEVLPSLYPTLATATHFDLQTRVGAWLHGLLADPARSVSTAELDRRLDDLAVLSSQRSGFLGIGLGLILAEMLSARLDPAEGCDWLGRWLAARIGALSDEQRAALPLAPAVRGPLTALHGSAPTPEIDALLSLFQPEPDLPALPTGDRPSPLFDAIVVVFSCLPNLETRIPAMRAGWLSLLEGFGIPYVVVVGGGDGTRRGDVVHLDAPDDYEGLPKKTMAALAWVHDTTRFAHMIKVDDDCFLNVPLFFQSLTYRKFDYYGRKLTRVPGQMDRAWHQGKSTSERARLALDKSPEPSSYADGGSGYALSRRAMTEALAALNSDDGRRLADVSFMEDKLLGDLLAMRGIHVADEDYRVAIRRRTHRDAIPVAAWNNGFFPSQAAPMQLMHLDTDRDQPRALEELARGTLRPAKIWPTDQGVKLGYQSNALELISDESTVNAARDAEVAVVACMRNEMFMLPHFLAHYRRLGVGAFLIADNASDDGTREYLAAQPDVALFSVDTDYRLSHYGVAWQQALLAAFRMGRWSVVADADELLVWQDPQRETLPALLARPEFAKAEAVRLFMLDMYPRGTLSSATFAGGDPFAEAGFADLVPFLTGAPMRGPFNNQSAWTSALRHRLIPGARPNLFTAQKLALLRYHPFMRLSEGMHFIGDVDVAARELIFAHFKYNADFRRKAKAEVARRQHFNDAEEYRKYLALASEGRDAIYDAELSGPWADSPFVRARLDPA